jgi:hypothetical protein
VLAALLLAAGSGAVERPIAMAGGVPAIRLAQSPGTSADRLVTIRGNIVALEGAELTVATAAGA